MYYYIKGELVFRDVNTCVVDCGGVAYKMTVSLITSESLSGSIGGQVKLFTHLAVREDGIELFGFGSNEERAAFNRLISVSGIGPKAAISILSFMTADKLALAICTEDVKGISKAPGIGPKTAARIVLELKDKVSKELMTASPKTDMDTKLAASIEKNTTLSEATEALMALGYDRNIILSLFKGIDTSGKDVGEIIKAALKKLAR